MDIERVSSDELDDNIARRFFSRLEFEALQAAPESQKNAAFFRIWTGKEAFIKALGLGLQRDLRSFDVLSPGDCAVAASQTLVADSEADDEAIYWLVRNLPTQPDIALACCAEGKDWSVVYHRDNI